MMNELSVATMKAFAEKERMKTMPSYAAYQAAHQDMMRNGDNSPCARNDDNPYLAACRKAWAKVVEEAGQAPGKEE